MERERSGARNERLHERIWQLLPWYVNGTLPGAEQKAVEDHLAACPRCREELSVTRELGAAVRAAEAVAPSPHPVQLTKLMARIDALEEDGKETRAGRAGALYAATPRPVRRLVVGQLAAMVLLLLGLAASWSPWMSRAPQPQAEPLFETLSDGGPAAPAEATHLRVVFAPEVEERQIREILTGIRGQLVGGPSPLGAYTVEIASGSDADPLEIVLGHLRARPEVRFAEPVASGGTGRGR